MPIRLILCAPIPAKENANAMLLCSRIYNLCLDLILSSEHIVNMRQIVCAMEEGVGLTDWGEILLQVGLLSEQAHL
jgi:hypothetical protein